MASKRKSTTPCMIPVKTVVLQDPGGAEAPAAEPPPGGARRDPPADAPAPGPGGPDGAALANGHRAAPDGRPQPCESRGVGARGGARCVGHVDCGRADSDPDPRSACAARALPAPTPEGLAPHRAEGRPGPDGAGPADPLCEPEIVITKTPIMKTMKGRADAKKIHTLKEGAPGRPVGEAAPAPAAGDAEARAGGHPVANGAAPPGRAPAAPAPAPAPAGPPTPPGPGPHPAPPPPPPPPPPGCKALPKVMIPLSSIPTYKAAMDADSFLRNSFHKFPYPTKAELCYLTVVTTYPEEQLKIWFTAQRLKQGISWSPEEIEDARKKMFNTLIQPAPQPTPAVLSPPPAAGARRLLQAALPAHAAGPPEAAGGAPLAQPPAPGPDPGPAPRPPAPGPPPPAPGPPPPAAPPVRTACALRVVSAAPALLPACPSITSQALLDAGVYKNKKSHEQLSALKGSFCRNQFPGQSEVEHLTRVTGLSTREVRKWFSDRRYHCRNLKGARAVLADALPDAPFPAAPEATRVPPPPAAPAALPPAGRQSWHQTPDFTAAKYRERAPEQLRALESSFAQNPLPLDEELDRLRTETKMTRREIDSWFSERRRKVDAEETTRADGVSSLEEGEAVEDEGGADDPLGDLRVPGENGSPEVPGSYTLAERKVSPIKINLKNLRVTEADGRSEPPGLGPCEPEDDGPSKLAEQPPGKVSCKKTAQQRHLLRQLFVQTQWPSAQDYDSIVAQTGLPRPEVVRWFGDSRYALKNGQLRWYEDYKRGSFPPGLQVVTPGSRELLQDYCLTHKTLCEEDLQSLCDKTQMSSQQVRQWFVEKVDEEIRAVADTGGEDQGPGDPAAVHKGLGDTYSEVSENSESWEPSAPEASSEPCDTPSPKPDVS